VNRKTQVVLAAVALSLLAGSTLAGVTGTEFQSLYDWINGVVTGYFGKAVAVAAVGLGALMSMARVNPIPILSGVGFAIFLQYTPTIISGVLTATI
jgi:conjugal transfer pilus assembly protein TraA